jgi:signal peptidase II
MYMNEQVKKNLQWLWLAVLVIALDQWTKHIVSTHMQLGESIGVLPVLNWTLMHNYGAAFSFLGDAGGWQRWLFAGIAVTVSAALTVWLWRLPAGARWLAAALVLVMGGALGNLYDRMVLGYVVDFVHVHYGSWNFPAFNLADSGITVGAGMLIIDALFLEKLRKVAHD